MFQLQIEGCPRDEVDALSDLLEETSSVSITLTDKHDDAILEPELGTTPLWPNVVVHAIYEDEEQALLAKLIVNTTYPHFNYAIQTLPEQDWQRTAVSDIKPQQFGNRLWICPSWLTPPDEKAVNLILDPGLAFGTGTHPTTSLCLCWLEQTALEQKSVIDYGCGSGILALAALKLGASHVDAVDIDEQALLATQNNAIRNHVSQEELTIGLPDALKQKRDILIANILLKPLIELRHRFKLLLKDSGRLVVSGILTEQVNELIDAYEDTFSYSSSTTEQGWALVEFT